MYNKSCAIDKILHRVLNKIKLAFVDIMTISILSALVMLHENKMLDIIVKFIGDQMGIYWVLLLCCYPIMV